VLAATDNDRCVASSRSAKAGTSASAGLREPARAVAGSGEGREAVRLGFEALELVGPVAVMRRVFDLDD